MTGKTDEELYDLVLPKGSKQEKAFIRLVVTFATLVKSSCKAVEKVFKQAKNANDERSVFIIKNIFQPVYERYISALSHSNQIILPMLFSKPQRYVVLHTQLSMIILL